MRSKNGSVLMRNGSLACVRTIPNVVARQTLGIMRFRWAQRNRGERKGPAHGVSALNLPMAAAGLLTRVVIEI